MRNLIVSLQLSLDGVAADPEKWMTLSDEIIEDSLTYYDSLDAILVGSTSYPSLAQYWQQAETASESDSERRFAKKINEIEKLVFSRSPVDLIWRNSRQLLVDDTESLRREIQKLRQSDGKAISVESGLTSWQLFLQNGLFDELMLYFHPVVAAQGGKLFDGVDALKLQLLDSKVYQNGVFRVHYQKVENS